MNTEYLRNISDINLEMLPPIMAEEYNKLKFKFDTKIEGTYFQREVINNFYADVNPDFDKNKLDKILQFNNNILDSLEVYDEGFWDGYYEENLFAGITKEEDQIFEIFSRIHNKLNKILNPDISRFKKNVTAYNSLNFIQKHLYDYGYEVGIFIKSWTIILNNITLFEGIFIKYYKEETLDNPYPDIFNGTDDRAYKLFDDFAKEVTDSYLDFSFIFQKMKSKTENLIKGHFPHFQFMDWLFEKKYINENQYSDFKIKASFSTKADRGMRATRYYKLKEKYFPEVSD